MYVPVVLTQARVRVCVKCASGELRAYVPNGRHKIVNETDVTSSVTVLMNYDRCLRLSPSSSPPQRLHARIEAYRYHAVYCVAYHGNRPSGRPSARTQRLGVDAKLAFVCVRVRWEVPKLAVGQVLRLTRVYLLLLS